MISETMLGIKEGSDFSLSYSFGLRLSSTTPAEIEFLVVSFPPTIRRIRLPKNSIGSLIMSLVSSPCANNDMKSNFLGSAARSCQSLLK